MLSLLESAALIFALRVVDISLYTMRLMMVVRGRKKFAWIFGFCQATVYVIAIRFVLTDIGNWAKIVGYASGFATGLVVGMLIEERLALGQTHLRIISSNQGPAICESLRAGGYGVTEIAARGKDGAVTMLSCNLQRKHAGSVLDLVAQIDPQAFITSESVRPVQHGFWEA
jgi:uncharacterized protein YebE (UPF0316 family)